MPGFLVIVAFLTLFWLGFSDKRDLFHLGAGVVSAILVAALTHGLLATGIRRRPSGRLALRYVYTFQWRRLLVFYPWVLWKILVANVQVTRLILHPRLPIDPAIIRIETGLRRDLSKMALATIITLTPGTCVLDIEGDVFVIHKIHPISAQGIRDEMVPMIRKTFEQQRDLDVDEAARGAGAEAGEGDGRA